MSDTDRDALRPIVRELMLEFLADGVDVPPSSQPTRRVENPQHLDALRTKAIDHRTRHADSDGLPGTDCTIGELGAIIRLTAESISGPEWIALESAINDLPADRKRLVVLDCADVRKLGSLGVGRLIVLHDSIADGGGMLAMINVTKPVAIVLQMMSVESVLHATPGGLDRLIAGLDQTGGPTR